MHNTAPTPPTLTAEQIRFAVDWAHRDVILVPDEIARRMNREIKDGWHEYPGWAYGVSRSLPAATWMYEVTTTLMAAFSASPVPDGLPDPDRKRAADLRFVAEKRWHLWPSVVGASDWDSETRSWRDYAAHHDLHVFGSAATDDGEDAFRYAA